MKTMRAIRSYAELEAYLKTADALYLLLYKKGSSTSDCAYTNILSAAKETDDITLLCADVKTVRDIHERYGIISVPNLLEFEKGEMKNIIKGCNDNKYYKNIFDHLAFQSGSANTDKPVKRVTVYFTPTCSWCTTLKNHLKQHNIKYTDIDVSRNQKAAEELVRRSGQRGVPQTEINGRIIVGFDKARLNQLLEIKE